MISPGMKCIKYLLFGFNLLFFVMGIALIVVGALVATTFSGYFAFFNSNVNMAAVYIIVIGVIVFLIAFFGCFGAIRESYGLIVTYCVLLSIIILLEVAAGIAVYIYRNQLTDNLVNRMKTGIPAYNETQITKAWDILQTNLKCCGAEQYTDWSANAGLNSTKSVPDTCCTNPSKGCGTGAITTGSNIYQKGCAKSLFDLVQEKIGIVGGISLGLGVFQILGVMIAVCLAHAIRKDYQKV